MGLTVFASNMGLFHKGSGGKGIAPGDVCLTPPTPPAGPIPVPYVNVISAADLAKGSSTVKVDGEPTALEDASELSTSTGNEAGTQGGGVVTHKTKGKASFTTWSFTVKIEAKGVCCHGDMLLQNTASKPPNCIDQTAITSLSLFLGADFKEPCTKPYVPSEHRPELTDDQYDQVKGGPCWECAKLPDNPGVWDTMIEKAAGENVLHEGTVVVKANPKGRIHNRSDRDKDDNVTKQAFTPDHQPPLVLGWYMGGCHDPEKFKKEMSERARVVPHCNKHSNSQGSQASAYAKAEYPMA